MHSGILIAQQNAMFSQYMFNTLAINPAYAGSRNVAAVTGLFRNQWVGMEGAPKTVVISADSPLSRERIGLGFQLFSDKIGITSTTGAVISPAYRIAINEARLAFGIQASFSQYTANFTSLSLDAGGTIYDPVYRENVNKFLLNFGSGVYYNTDRLYIGLSVLDLLNNRLNKDTVSKNGVTARQSSHAYFAAGYVFPMGSDFNLKTSMLLKGVKGAPVQADLNATLWIKDVIALGAEYRSSADISALMELRITPGLRIGYAYDRSITSLRNFNSGSHEVMLRYEFSFDRSNTLSPRYF